MEEKKGIFTIVNEEGKEVECEILFTFESEENTKVYASIYDPTGQSAALTPIETEKEWKVIENILTSVQQKIEEASSSNK